MAVSALVSGLVTQFENELGIGRDINNGSCEDFAQEIIRVAGRGETHWIGQLFLDGAFFAEVGHCAALIDGLWYDAETPEGVEDWRQLGGGRWGELWGVLSDNLTLRSVAGTSWQFEEVIAATDRHAIRRRAGSP